MKIRKYLLPLAAILIFSFTDSFAGIDQASIERLLKDNREFVDFINVCVTNFNMDKKNDLFTIYQKHFNAEISYLQGNYKRAFDEIYSSQKDMVELYELILTEHYLEDSKNILDGYASEIIKFKNSAAKHYLSLGYRDRTIARNLYIAGEATYPKLYSYKINKYLEAIILSRRAKRYAFFALYTGQDGKTKLRIYNQLFKTESESGNTFFNRFIDKDEKEYIAEMNKTYEEYLSEIQKNQSEESNTSSTENKNDENNEATKIAPFEKKAERSSRFKKEQRLAQYILNEEFAKAEPIIRTYVDNYNFKLIMATLIVLGDSSHTGESDSSETGKDYKQYINHHNDNYLKLNEKSALESVAGDAKIVDYVKKDDKKEDKMPDDQQQIEGNTSPEVE
ncbi:MAG: hypothetical protein FWH53_09825 [Leptospirales bacterium]|nr:hypothetical protein [Leptospirales bacterium]